MQQVSKHQTNHIMAKYLLFLFAIVMNSMMLPAAAETHVVEMKKYKFIPEEITIKVGDTIRWLNIERRQYHTIWFKQSGGKETPELFPEETFEQTFTEPGDHPYICGPHHEDYDMIGIVHVTP